MSRARINKTTLQKTHIHARHGPSSLLLDRSVLLEFHTLNTSREHSVFKKPHFHPTRPMIVASSNKVQSKAKYAALAATDLLARQDKARVVTE